jgi:hypothetical protein
MPNPHNLQLTIVNPAGGAVNGCVVTFEISGEPPFRFPGPGDGGRSGERSRPGRPPAPDDLPAVILEQIAVDFELEVVEPAWRSSGTRGIHSNPARIGRHQTESAGYYPAKRYPGSGPRASRYIGQAAQRLEAENPRAAAHGRLSQAILQAARSALVGRINNCFDQVMERTTAEYKFRAQAARLAGETGVGIAEPFGEGAGQAERRRRSARQGPPRRN